MLTINTLRKWSGNIDVQTTYEANEQKVNEIFALTLALGSNEYTSTQRDELITIAEQCPITGGPKPVYMARGMLRLKGVIVSSLIDCTKEKEDKANDRARVTNDTQFDFAVNIYPNPAIDDIIVTYSFYEKVDRELVIYDFMGRMIKSYSLEKNKGKIIVEQKGLSSGVHLFAIRSNGRSIYTEKVIIQN